MRISLTCTRLRLLQRGSIGLMLGLLCACGPESETPAPDARISPNGSPNSSPVAAPTPEERANAVAVYRSGTVSRAEFEHYVERANRLEQDLSADTTDWRATAARDLALCEFLATQNPPPSDAVRTRIEDDVLGPLMRRELGWDTIEISTDELRAEYDANPQRYISPEQIRLQLIFLRRPKDDPAAADTARQQLVDLRQQILDGADFAEMARRHSQSSTAEGGGWMILRRDANVFPGFIETAWSLEMSEVSDLIETPTGFFLIRPASSQPGQTRAFDEVTEFATDRARDTKLLALRDAFIENAQEHFTVERYYERLRDPRLRDDEPLITIDDDIFTAGDLINQINAKLLPGLYVGFLDRIEQFLDDTLARGLLVREARRLGFAERPEVQANVDAAVRQAACDQQIETRLVKLAAAVDDATLRETYEQYKQRYQTVRTRSFSVIFLPSSDDQPNWQVLEQAEAFVEELRLGADFTAVAERHSQHVSVTDGGRIVDAVDQVSSRLLPMRAASWKIVNGLEVGEIAEPVMAEVYDAKALTHHRKGVLIIRLDDVKPPRQYTFEEVADSVRENYLRRNYQSLRAEVIETLADEIDFRFIPENLPGLSLPG